MGPLFESPPGPLLTSDMRPLDRYGTHQKTISRRPEQMYSPSDTGLGMAWGGSLFSRSRINAAGPNCDYYSNHFLGHY